MSGTTSVAQIESTTVDGMTVDQYVASKMSPTSSKEMTNSWQSVHIAKFHAIAAERAKIGLSGSDFTAAENRAIPLRLAAKLAWDAHSIAYSAGNALSKANPQYRAFIILSAKNGDDVAGRVATYRKIS